MDLMVCINLSTSPLALGHSGVIFPCLKPRDIAKSAKLNGGPLSARKVSHMPYSENILSTIGITLFVNVDVMISTRGNLE